MDSKERHELMTNELADWLGHVPDFLNKYRNQIIGLLLIIVGLISWPILNRWRQRSDSAVKSEISAMLDSLENNKVAALQHQRDETQLFSSDSFMAAAGNLSDDAKKAPSDDLSAVALIKRGQALRMDLFYRSDSLTDDMISTQIKQAQEAYQQAFDKAEMPAVKAMAQFGLGLCSEDLGMLEQAKDIYQKIADEPSFAGTPLTKAAQDRIDNMTDNNIKYVFADVPKETVPSIQAGDAEPTFTSPAPVEQSKD